MKVILKGTERKYRCTCTKCNSIIEYSGSEVREKKEERYYLVPPLEKPKPLIGKYKPDRWTKCFYNKLFSYIICPVCYSIIELQTIKKYNVHLRLPCDMESELL